MSTSARRFAGWLCVAAFALVSTSVFGAVTQPNGDSIPIPAPPAEVSVATSRGFAASAVTLQGLFDARGETLNPVADAKISPGAFSPTCGFSGQLVLRGGSAIAALGWYNVDDPVQPPPVYELVPTSILTTMSNTQDDANTPNVNECVVAATAAGALCGGGDHDFCPLATPSVIQPTQHCWTDVPFLSGNIKSDTHYRGGLVGFALWKNDHTKQIKYSEAKLNVPCTAPGCGPNDRWVTALIWQSTVNPEGFYLGFEDLGMDPSNWHKLPPGDSSSSGMCDGDFNDFVYFVSGVSCQGGNQPCTTDQLGACSVGKTDCAPDGVTPACRPVIQKGVEVCDNVDNDCDGVIDNGDGLCPDPNKPTCFQGACVGTCSGGEFQCPIGLTCDDSGHCSDPKCATVTCPAGTACRSGTCVDPCTGVTCPYGTQCELGQCVDPCAGVTCPNDTVCEKGLCLGNCSCRGCDTGLTCGADGKCVDTACANKMCAAGLVCKLGDCIDPCAGVVCPNQGVCSMGTCTAGNPGGGATDSGGGTSISFGGGSTGINFGGAPNDGSGAAGRISSSSGTAKGCGCRLAGQPSPGSTPLALLGSALGLGLLLRRRRRAAA